MVVAWDKELPRDILALVAHFAFETNDYLDYHDDVTTNPESRRRWDSVCLYDGIMHRNMKHHDLFETVLLDALRSRHPYVVRLSRGAIEEIGLPVLPQIECRLKSCDAGSTEAKVLREIRERIKRRPA